MDDGKIQGVQPPTGSTHDAEWWRSVCDDQVIQRIGVPVRFWPRPFHSGAPLRNDHGFHGTIARVIRAPLYHWRYPGEVCLWNVKPGELIFGESWIASGDVLVIDSLLEVYQRGGAHL